MIYKSQRFNNETRCLYYVDMSCPRCESNIDKTYFMEIVELKNDDKEGEKIKEEG